MHATKLLTQIWILASVRLKVENTKRETAKQRNRADESYGLRAAEESSIAPKASNSKEPYQDKIRNTICSFDFLVLAS